MNKQLKTCIIFLGIWVIASLLNGLLSGACIIIISSKMFTEGVSVIGLALICSFLFSAPLVGVVWLVAFIAISSGRRGDTLFQTILAAALILGVIGAVFSILILKNEFNGAGYAVGACITASALAAPLFFRKAIKSND